MTEGDYNAANNITYEQPLSERMRLFMRLESMFCQMQTFRNAEEYYSIQLFLDAMFDVLDFLHRYEIRSEILKDLHRIQNAICHDVLDISHLKETPETLCPKIQHTLEEIHQLNLNPISALRENELFTSLRQRNFNQSGNCLFEVPAYQYWLSKYQASDNSFLNYCDNLFVPIFAAIKLILCIIRHSAEIEHICCEDGMFLRTINQKTRNQMLRIHLAQDATVFPRISGDNHRFAIRFMVQDDPRIRATQTTESIEFSLQVCTL